MGTIYKIIYLVYVSFIRIHIRKEAIVNWHVQYETLKTTFSGAENPSNSSILYS